MNTIKTCVLHRSTTVTKNGLIAFIDYSGFACFFLYDVTQFSTTAGLYVKAEQHFKNLKVNVLI